MQVKPVKTCGVCAFAGLCAGIRTITKMVADRTGATIIEYGFLAGLVGLAMIGAAQIMGVAITGLFDAISIGFVSSMPQTP